MLSMFSASFGITKFQLNGPFTALPRNSALSGTLSTPFFLTLVLNTMFGVRIFLLESIFFSTYRLTKPPVHFNTTHYDHLIDYAKGNYTSSIEPIIAPEYRLLVFLFPCAISMLANAIRLSFTIRGSRTFLVRFPQFLVTPAFSPLMFEGVDSNQKNNDYPIKVWKVGSVINAIFIGIIPPIALLISDFQRGITKWEFNQTNFNNFNSEFNDAIFKHILGNTVFSLTCLALFSTIIVLFFFSEYIFVRQGIHCRVLNVLCCPCPNSCIIYHPELEVDSEPFESNIVTSNPRHIQYQFL